MFTILRKLVTCCLLAMAFAASACVPTTHDPAMKTNTLSTDNTRAGDVVIEPPDGPPAPMAELLARSVADALVRRGFLARAVKTGSPDETEADFHVSGTAEALDTIHAPTVAALHWILRDGEGQEIAYLTQGVRGNPDSWAYGSPAMLRIVGDEAAADFSVFLGSPPNAPVVPVVAAQPGFEPEMLGQINADGGVGATADSMSTTQNAGNVAAQLPTPPTPPPLPVTSGLTNIRDFGLWLDEVTGAPGNGNAALTQAIFADLKRNELPFAMTPGLASHYIQGVVDVAVRSATQEHVTIVWVVSNAQGEEIGRVTQRNDIVRGSLHGEWGDTAVYAARGGLEGILAILERDLEVTLK